MQYAKKVGYYMGTKHTMGICRRMGDPVSEKRVAKIGDSRQ